MSPFELHRGAYKNLTLRLTREGEVRVTAPWFLPKKVIEDFVREKAGWIETRRSQLPPPAAVFPSAVSVWGAPKGVRIETPGRLPRVVETEGEVVVRVAPSAGLGGAAARLREWEKERVRAALDRLVPEWAARMRLRPERWTVKWLKSRWGSCRPDRRTLVFNAELARLPFACLEHVVVHELVHLLEPSHNARFHALMAQWLPDNGEVRRLLKRGVYGDGNDAFPGPPSKPSGQRELPEPDQ